MVAEGIAVGVPAGTAIQRDGVADFDVLIGPDLSNRGVV
jgi:hypothetical protein|tara:strand:+ start:437 stop:553 length:117 start_codon:yes stop_codon:yes gene_type:complete